MRRVPEGVLLAGALLTLEAEMGPGGSLMLRLVGGMCWRRKEVRRSAGDGVSGSYTWSHTFTPSQTLVGTSLL